MNRFLFVAFLSFSCIVGFFFYVEFLMFVPLLLANVYFLFLNKRYFPFFLIGILILYFNYSILAGEYWLSKNIAPDTGARADSIQNISLFLLAIFNIFFLVPINNYHISWSTKYLNRINDPILFFVFTLLSIISVLFGLDWSSKDIYEPSGSALFEYSVIFIFFAFYTSKSIRLSGPILFFLSLMVILSDFINGGRITSLQLSLLLLILYFPYVNNHKIGFSLFALFGIYILTVVSEFRRNFNFDFSIFYAAFETLFSGALILNTATFAYYSSLTIIASADFVSANYIIESFYRWVLSLLFGSKLAGFESLSVYASANHYVNWGGAMPHSYFWFWFGVPGVVLFAIFMSAILNFVQKGVVINKYKSVILVTLVFTSPRWYLYTPSSFFRSIVLVTLILAMIYLYRTVLKNR